MVRGAGEGEGRVVVVARGHTAPHGAAHRGEPCGVEASDALRGVDGLHRRGEVRVDPRNQSLLDHLLRHRGQARAKRTW